MVDPSRKAQFFASKMSASTNFGGQERLSTSGKYRFCDEDDLSKTFSEDAKQGNRKDKVAQTTGADKDGLVGHCTLPHLLEDEGLDGFLGGLDGVLDDFPFLERLKGRGGGVGEARLGEDIGKLGGMGGRED